MPGPTVQALNSRPLNREAKDWLLKAKQEPDPSFQYLYQLLLWGLGPGGLKWEVQDMEVYRNFLERVAFQDDQGGAYRYLVEDPRLGPEEPRLQPGDLAELDSPKAAARRLLEAFQEGMTADESLVPSYPPGATPE